MLLLQFFQFAAYVFDKHFVASQVYGTNTAIETKPKPPVTAVPVTAFVLGEVSFPTQRV